MAKYTLLEMTQNILARMSSDEVNSIGDTSEAQQVANIIKNKYYDIIDRVNLPDHDQMIQLAPSLDATQPVLMYVPSGVSDIKWIKYFDSKAVGGVTPGYTYVTILPVQQFVDIVTKFNPTATDVTSFTFSDTSNNYPGNYTFYYKNNRQPLYCTIISNYYIIFDSFNKTYDTTLQASKSMSWGRVIPVFKLEDSFIPDLADEQFQLLVNEATSLAYFELKQQPHQLAAQEAKRMWSGVQKNKAVTNRPTYFDELPDFGRSGRGFHSNTSYFKSRGFDK